MRESTERFKTVTADNLETAAQMFIFLIICPYKKNIKSKERLEKWSKLYIDLLTDKSPRQIVLSLNSFMKSSTTLQEKLWAGKLLKKAASLIPLYYEGIQSMLPGRAKNQSVTGKKNVKKEILTIAKSINHPVHIVSENNKMSPSAFIPFCDFGGNMSAVGIRIEQFGIPVCKSFKETTLNNQICYEVDLNDYRNEKNIQRQLKLGFIFFLDYNEERQFAFNKISKIRHSGSNDSLASTIVESDQKKHAILLVRIVCFK